MDRKSAAGIVKAISGKMTANRNYLIELDQVNGDGDLGISMDDGYRAAAEFLERSEIQDLGRLILECGKVFNSAAPSSLGTIMVFGFMGIAKALKGKTQVSFGEAAEAMLYGVEQIMEKAGSKMDEKTIIDSLYPGALALVTYGRDPARAVAEAEKSAANGAERTKMMKAVHGRAAYSAQRSIGILDGGAVAGALIFKAIREYYQSVC